MPIKVNRPTIIKAAGNKPKEIKKFLNNLIRANQVDEDVIEMYRYANKEDRLKYRGILYAVPRKLDLTNYKLIVNKIIKCHPAKPLNAMPAKADKAITEIKAVTKYKIIPFIKFFPIS